MAKVNIWTWFSYYVAVSINWWDLGSEFLSWNITKHHAALYRGRYYAKIGLYAGQQRKTYQLQSEKLVCGEEDWSYRLACIVSWSQSNRKHSDGYQRGSL